MENASSKPEGSRLRSSLKIRLKITACATLLLAAVTTVFVWRTANASPQQSAAPAATPTAQATPSQPALPSYFSGLKAPDSTGSNYGVWSTPSGTPNADGSPSGDIPGKLGIGDLYDRILHNQYSINIIWTLLSGALVYFMQLGFAFLEAGFARAKNANHTMAMLMMVFVIGTAAYWVYGFALGWGNWFNGPAAPGIRVSVPACPRSGTALDSAAMATAPLNTDCSGPAAFFSPKVSTMLESLRSSSSCRSLWKLASPFRLVPC